VVKQMGCNWTMTRSLPRKSSRTLAFAIGILLLSESVVATATATSVSIAQQPATSSPNATTTDEQQAYARGQQLLDQARQLSDQGTAESQEQALPKYFHSRANKRTTFGKPYLSLGAAACIWHQRIIPKHWKPIIRQ
jgi:hypothetical protein